MSVKGKSSAVMKKSSSESSSRSFAGVLLISAVMALMLSGCAVGPDYHQPHLDLPGQWNATQTSLDNATDPEVENATEPVESPRLEDLKKWWTSLGDPILDKLIDDAVKGNLDVASAQARVREARGTYRQAGGSLLPQVDGGASAIRTGYGKKSSQSMNGKSNYFTTFQAGFDASWELDFFGKNRRILESAKYGLDAANEDLRSTLLTLIGDIAINYVRARGYQTRIALARNTASSQRETARLTREKFLVGSSSAVDMDRAEADVNTTEADIPDFETSYYQAVHRLGILLGQPPATLLKVMHEPAPIPVPKRELPVGVPANILLNRPDVRMAERQLAEYTANIGAAEALRYPSISLTGSINTSTTKFDNVFDSSTIGWAIGPTLTIPIFNGGQLKAGVDIAVAQRDQSYYAYKAVVLSALEDVENYTIAMSRAKRKLKSLSKAARNYREATKLSRLLYRNGAIAILDVLDSERSLYSAEDNFVLSKIAITESYISLAKALGGGWDKALDSGKPLEFDEKGVLKKVSAEKASVEKKK
ncbi:efflux transporter outer membrane subunit [Maridesulfovibrio bastinii]|uniref:efflux transporter outer membrane subunit n=1 Tax=Maridesulfovibrio bastinii TaxID=47157 RepID=UPI0004034FF6|nr:efflux transporter outer membrane subunit [Maridesulfovibrio bastinii]